MKTSFNVGKILGIPIYLHITFLLILPLFAWIFAIASFNFYGLEVGFGSVNTNVIVKFIFGIIAAVMFFASILAHELAHSYMAQQYGVKIKSITLHIFGGISQIEDIPKTPRLEFNISVVGPLSSVAIGLVALVGAIAFNAAKGVIGPGLLYNFFFVTFSTLAFYNLLVGGFNLIPAFPMDGGRILRSYLARSMPYVVATQRAASVGRTIAIIMGIFGFFFNFWLILIAFFIYIGASEEERMTTVTVTLEGVKVDEIMTPVNDLVTVPPDMKVSEFVKLMLHKRHMAYPIIQDGKLIGVVAFPDILKVPQSSYENATVRDIMAQRVVTIDANADALEALKKITSEEVNRVLVMDGDKLVGMVTRNDLSTAVTILGQTRVMKTAPPIIRPSGAGTGAHGEKGKGAPSS